MRCKYRIGDCLGLNNIKLLKITRKTTVWWGELECPYCGKTYERRLPDVDSGRGYQHCGCMRNKNFHNTMLSKRDLTGQTFGRLTVIENDNGMRDKNNNVLKKCICSCKEHNIVYKNYYYLTHADCPSCGCVGKEISKQNGLNNKRDLTGQKFGKLTVVKDSGLRKQTPNGTMIIWDCVCDCDENKIVQVSSNDLTSGNTMSCGCMRSRGEELIGRILSCLNIDFKNNYHFIDCKNPKTDKFLYFDFYLLNYNICIEYDGEQHYTYSNTGKGWNTYDNFKDTQYRDSIKDQYCKDHNIPLIRIPYWDYEKLNEDYLATLINNAMLHKTNT